VKQAACFLATEERMLYQMLLIVSKVIIVVVVAQIYSVRILHAVLYVSYLQYGHRLTPLDHQQYGTCT